MDPGKQISICPDKFPKNFNFFKQFHKHIWIFQGNFLKISIFQANFRKIEILFRQFYFFPFSRQKLAIYSYLWANYFA